MSDAKPRNRITSNVTVTVFGEPAPSTSLAIPPGAAPGAPMWNTNDPWTGCESAETTRQATVYVPFGRPPLSGTETSDEAGWFSSPVSTRFAFES